MTETTRSPSTRPWTCPFCALLCDDLAWDGDLPPRLSGSDCPRALAALATFATPASANATVDGATATNEAAIVAAAASLAAARLPLFAGLATDVAGMRALYRLANTTGAVLDHAHGDGLMNALQTLQSRGLLFSTLAEVRNRADLVVCIGTRAVERYPDFFKRIQPLDGAAERRVVFLAAGEPLPAVRGLEGAQVSWIAPEGDVFDAVSALAALVDGRRVAGTGAAGDSALAALAADMRAARYCVVVWEPGALPPHAALIGEAVLRIVTRLNQRERGGAFVLGGADGGQTANAVMTWLSGLPLRSRVGPQGVDHDPVRYSAARLLADGAVDALLWVASLGADLPPPQTALPQVVLGHPALAGTVSGPGRIFIPVATPGVNAAGHLFRADGVVSLPVERMRDDGLPTVAEVVTALERAILKHHGEGAR